MVSAQQLSKFEEFCKGFFLTWFSTIVDHHFLTENYFSHHVQCITTIRSYIQCRRSLRLEIREKRIIFLKVPQSELWYPGCAPQAAAEKFWHRHCRLPTGPGGAWPPNVFWCILGINLHLFECLNDQAFI